MRRKKKGEPESKNKRIKLAPVLRKTITEPDEGPALQGVRFSNHSTHKAPQITLDEERLTARGYKVKNLLNRREKEDLQRILFIAYRVIVK